ncbi:hypothetical protein [Celeribacter baekdonensis]|nr:hypothetical protein [Celeribacter baekdonensis]
MIKLLTEEGLVPENPSWGDIENVHVVQTMAADDGTVLDVDD